MMCDRHLLGEHVELHMLVGSLNRGKRLDGFTRKGLIEVDAIESRHEALVVEMSARGMNHKSPLPTIEQHNTERVKVSVGESIRELKARCARCKARMEEQG